MNLISADTIAPSVPSTVTPHNEQRSTIDLIDHGHIVSQRLNFLSISPRSATRDPSALSSTASPLQATTPEI